MFLITTIVVAGVISSARTSAGVVTCRGRKETNIITTTTASSGGNECITLLVCDYPRVVQTFIVVDVAVAIAVASITTIINMYSSSTNRDILIVLAVKSMVDVVVDVTV